MVFNYTDQGVSTMEDGLYVLEQRLSDPAFAARMAKFVRAAMKGWDYARANPDEAAKIVLDNDTTARRRAPPEAHDGRDQQAHRRSNGKLDPADYERTVATLLGAGGEAPVISKKPVGAWTHAIIDAALK